MTDRYSGTLIKVQLFVVQPKAAQGVSENTIFARFLAMWVTAVFDIIYGGF